MNRSIWFNAEIQQQIEKECKNTGETFNAVVNRRLKASYGTTHQQKEVKPAERRKMGRMKKVDGVWVKT